MSDAKTIFVVSGGFAVDAILVPANATITSGGKALSWTDGGIDAADGASFLKQDGAAIGWKLTGGALVAPAPDAPPPAPVPSTISDRQFAHGLWKQNVITFEEARDFLKVGEMPAALAGLVAQMPPAQRKDAELMITGSTSFERAHPFTAAIAAAFGWTNEVTDEFWTYAAAL